MIDLHAHLGRERVRVGYDLLMDILHQDRVVVEPGDMVCLHTGFAQMLLEMNKQPDPHAVENSCAVLEGRDERLLQWITDSGLVALIADNYAVEGLPATPRPGSCASLPLHEHCLFKLGVHLGEIWHLTPLAEHLRQAGRSRFLLTAPPLRLPEQLTSPEWSNFLCYVEWAGDYRYVIDNVMDPMHGVYLHKQSHTMSEGDSQAEFQIRDIPNGFCFEKKGQRGVNFDWTEWMDLGIHVMRLEIPYPKTGGPGGNFTIIGSYTPINNRTSGVFHWRCRRVSGWQRDAWRFLYKNRLEERHWNVLEQDRVAVENMEPDANKREHLYAHDMGIVRLRRHLRNLAKAQLDKAV